MGDRDPSFSHRTWQVWTSVQMLLRQYIRDTGEVTISLSDLIPLCRSATIEAERWVGHRDKPDYLEDEVSLARQLQQNYHKPHRPHPGIADQEQYSVAQLQAIANTFADKAFWDLFEQSHRRG